MCGRVVVGFALQNPGEGGREPLADVVALACFELADVDGIWESREAFERFSDEKLMPAIKEVMGDVQPPPEAAPQFYDVQVVVIPR